MVFSRKMADITELRSNAKGLPMEKAKEILLATGRLALKVIPGARVEEIGGLVAGTGGDELAVKVRAAAEGGKANEAVIDLLAGQFGLPRSSLAIIRGGTGRHKIIAYRRR
jgi:uncharacterized protein YggU (UPF0235/DUF167 family)